MSDLKDQIKEQQERARIAEAEYDPREFRGSADAPGATRPEDDVGEIPSTKRRTSKGTLVTYGVVFAIIIVGVFFLKHEINAFLTAPKKKGAQGEEMAMGLPPLQIPPAPAAPASATPAAPILLSKPPAPATGGLGAFDHRQGPPQITLAQRRQFDPLMMSGQDTNAVGQQPGANAMPSQQAPARPAYAAAPQPYVAPMPAPTSFNQASVGGAGSSGAAPAPGPQSNNPDSLGGNLKPTRLALASARVLPNRNFIITKGTSLECALDTAIDTTLPSLTTCTLTRNVYSDNGNVILLDRGSKLVGEFRSGVQQGQARVFVLWDRVETPEGVVINITSPGADRLGRGGNTGYVDNHFWQRFGAAILMSFISDTTAALVNRETASNNAGAAAASTFAYTNTVNSGQEVVKSMLKSSVDIPPTIRINQGAHIQVMVARDLSFANVYQLKTRDAH
ncbi:Type IV secretory pathway, VirB10 component [Thiomonas arsenitoxydans]|uniref:Type IV secretory pathway, VirB10 component n=1 Tax=Thiomonas arsenitoxydans (strain DSM 22701 / CIP 110005 / 3As) TaxID=426114 RepID=D6CVV6_THIA3|nr:type IV secretion system protein VirB10 [Thiomonas arsenitoxydans]CAZ90445.1 Type IV secretory pathway, VirB10 component [Thiomonas arsenitoxydans]CQR32618.1 Type IV secretory pathway, VirB10 component [Thiomonas arsenitoxydans]CQR45726.1 Type IV secretory pathway, VirB10 component [Thiomonas sp. CB3]